MQLVIRGLQSSGAKGEAVKHYLIQTPSWFPPVLIIQQRKPVHTGKVTYFIPQVQRQSVQLAFIWSWVSVVGGKRVEGTYNPQHGIVLSRTGH